MSHGWVSGNKRISKYVGVKPFLLSLFYNFAITFYKKLVNGFYFRKMRIGQVKSAQKHFYIQYN